MRHPGLLALAFLLLATACGEDPLPPPEPPPGPAPEVAPPSVPAPLRDADSGLAAPSAPAPSEASASEESAVREPPEWGDLEISLREESDPADLLLRKDLDATRIFVELDGVSIADAASALGASAGVAIVVSPGCYEEYSAEELEVTVASGTRSVSEALGRVCVGARRRLVWWVQAGVVKIAPSRPAPESVSLLIPLGRLARRGGDTGPEAARGYEPDAIADIVRARIDPDVWDEGADVRIHWPLASGPVWLSVKAPRATARKILALLRELHGSLK